MMHALDLRHFKLDKNEHESILIKATKWLRASHSGMFLPLIKNGSRVVEGTVLGLITDPFGKIERKVKSTIDGYVFCVNEAPIVNKGDALFKIGSPKEIVQEGLIHQSIID